MSSTGIAKHISHIQNFLRMNSNSLSTIGFGRFLLVMKNTSLMLLLVLVTSDRYVSLPVET